MFLFLAVQRAAEDGPAISTAIKYPSNITPDVEGKKIETDWGRTPLRSDENATCAIGTVSFDGVGAARYACRGGLVSSL